MLSLDFFTIYLKSAIYLIVTVDLKRGKLNAIFVQNKFIIT